MGAGLGGTVLSPSKDSWCVAQHESGEAGSPLHGTSLARAVKIGHRLLGGGDRAGSRAVFVLSGE